MAAAENLTGQLDSGDALQACGMLHLSAALAADAQANRATAATHLQEASTLAARMDTEVGTWANLWFGPTNIGIWRTGLAVELGEHGQAREAAKTVHPELLPYPARQAEFWIEVGRALVAEKKTRQEGLQVLLRAERLAPQIVRNDLFVREAVADLLRRARGDAGGRKLRGLAWRLGLAPIGWTRAALRPVRRAWRHRPGEGDRRPAPGGVAVCPMASYSGSHPQDPLRRTLGGGWSSFLAAAMRSPRDVGTLLPSGPELAQRLAAVIPGAGQAGRPTVVVEVGAGAGAVTAAIVREADHDAVVIAIEKDPGLAHQLRSRELGVRVVTADAATLAAILADHGVDCADVIISVLPWTLFNPRQQREFLTIFAAALATDGVFTAAAYSWGYWTPAARRFRQELGRVFGEVLPTRTMWRHLPPAMTYVCRGPRAADADITADPSR